MSETFPTEIGPYQIVREIGKGGMSFVYRALDTRTDKQVALKVLPTRHADDPAYVRRFIREGQNASRLTHPNIVRVYEAGAYDEYHTIAMELIEGGSLTDYLRGQWDLLPPQIPINVIQQIANGLDYAHSQGFLHRDIKPSNILLSGDLHEPTTRVLISDFGVARRLTQDMTAVTQTGFTVGTPNFMSPEQARGDEDIDRRSDIYGLGAVAYVLFTGKMPFKADTQLALMHKVVYEPPTPPERLNPQIPPGVAYTLKKVLSKDRNQRFDTALELAVALDHGLNWVPSTSDMEAVKDDSTVPRLPARNEPTPVKKKEWPVMPTMLSALAILVALLFFAVLPAGQPLRQSLGIEAIPTEPSQPIVLSAYRDPDGHFKMDVPDTWSRTVTDEVTSFESTEFIGQLFVQRMERTNTEAPLQAALDAYVQQPNLPFTGLKPTQSTQPRIVRQNAEEALYTGRWLGVDIVLRLVAVADENSSLGYIIGSAIDVTEEKNFGHLTDTVLGSFAFAEDTGLASNAGQTGQGSAASTGQTESNGVAAVSTRRPTSTPLPATQVPPSVTPVNTPTATVEAITSRVQEEPDNEAEASGVGSASTRSQSDLTATADALQEVVNQKLTSIASALPPAVTTAQTMAPTVAADAIDDAEEDSEVDDAEVDGAENESLVNSNGTTSTLTSVISDTLDTEEIRQVVQSRELSETVPFTVTDPVVDGAPTEQPATQVASARASATATPETTNTATATVAATNASVAAATTRLATNTATDVPTTTSTATQTATPENTPTSRATDTPEATSTATSRATSTASATSVPTAANTATPTDAPTNTPTSTAASTATSTATSTLTSTVVPTATATATATSMATAMATATATATAAATATSTATATAEPTTTATSTHTLTPISTSTTTDTPTPRPTQTATNTPSQAVTATATATTSSSTPTTTPTPRDTPIATITATASVASVPSNARVKLEEPLEAVLQGRYDFSWSSNITLQPGQLFELIFWEAGRDPIVNGFGPVGAKSETSLSIDLNKIADALPQFEPGREYEWGVLLVTESPYRRLRFLGGGHQFRFERSSGGSGGGSGGGERTPPTPRPRG